MHFSEPINRAQVTFGSLEDLMPPDNPVRLIDAFADRLDLKRLGFGVKVKAPPKTEVFDELLANARNGTRNLARSSGLFSESTLFSQK
jgi:hypothetical protein